MKFDNTYASLPEKFYSKSEANEFSEPQLLAFNEKLAEELGGVCYTLHELKAEHLYQAVRHELNESAASLQG